MKHLWKQLNKEREMTGVAQTTTVILTAISIVSALVYIIYSGIVSTNAEVKEKLFTHEESIVVLKSDMAIIKVQLDTVISTQKAMMMLLKEK
jgi:uncharacterized membrane protein YbhN (UPF0104 family)